MKKGKNNRVKIIVLGALVFVVAGLLGNGVFFNTKPAKTDFRKIQARVLPPEPNDTTFENDLDDKYKPVLNDESLIKRIALDEVSKMEKVTSFPLDDDLTLDLYKGHCSNQLPYQEIPNNIYTVCESYLTLSDGNTILDAIEFDNNILNRSFKPKKTIDKFAISGEISSDGRKEANPEQFDFLTFWWDKDQKVLGALVETSYITEDGWTERDDDILVIKDNKFVNKARLDPDTMKTLDAVTLPTFELKRDEQGAAYVEYVAKDINNKVVHTYTFKLDAAGEKFVFESN
jgi:hypothetical protein